MNECTINSTGCNGCSNHPDTSDPGEFAGTGELVRAIVTFVAVCIAVGMLISATYAFTAPVISKRLALEAARAASGQQRIKQFKVFFPSCSGFNELGNWTINDRNAKYFSVQESDKTIGYAIESFGKGFSSLISVIVGVNISGEIAGIDIVNQEETPGLGDQVTGNDFKNQFIGKKIGQLTVAMAGKTDEITAITGATISSRAVAEDAVRSAVKFINENIPEK